VGDALIEFVCRAPTHRVTIELRIGSTSGSPVTVYERKWAYCSAGATVDHDWQAIAPIALADLKRVELAKT
jgi:hypothetical protein